MSESENIFEAIDLTNTAPSLICVSCAAAGLEHRPTGCVFAYCRYLETVMPSPLPLRPAGLGCVPPFSVRFHGAHFTVETANRLSNAWRYSNIALRITRTSPPRKDPGMASNAECLRISLARGSSWEKALQVIRSPVFLDIPALKCSRFLPSLRRNRKNGTRQNNANS